MEERTIFVNKLPTKATEDEVRDFFQSAGEIEEVRIIMEAANQELPKNKGFCYVQFFNKESVKIAVELFDGKPFYPDQLKGDLICQNLSVQPSESKKDRQARHSSQSTLHVTNLSYSTTT